jgi:hypothetical protein
VIFPNTNNFSYLHFWIILFSLQQTKYLLWKVWKIQKNIKDRKNHSQSQYPKTAIVNILVSERETYKDRSVSSVHSLLFQCENIKKIWINIWLPMSCVSPNIFYPKSIKIISLCFFLL